MRLVIMTGVEMRSPWHTRTHNDDDLQRRTCDEWLQEDSCRRETARCSISFRNIVTHKKPLKLQVVTLHCIHTFSIKLALCYLSLSPMVMMDINFAVCLFVWFGRISLETAQRIWLKFCTEMEVCPGHRVSHFGGDPPAVPPEEPKIWFS